MCSACCPYVALCRRKTQEQPRNAYSARAYCSACTGSHLLGGILHSAHNILVACTTANIAFETFANLFFGRVGVVFEQLVGSHNHAWRAEPALQAMFLPETLLEWMEIGLVRSQSLNGRYFTTVGLNSQHCA